VYELTALLDATDERNRTTAEDTNQDPAEDTTEDSTVAARVTRRIVLVEDQDDLRASFRALLEQNGHRVTEASDGVTGLACILDERPDVAIVDIGLRGLDGYDVARRVRAVLGASVRLIATTGLGGERDRRAALDAGFEVHLVKPFDFAVIETLRQAR